MARHRRRRYPGYLRRRGDSFRWEVCVGGKRHAVTIPTTDRRAAERFAIERTDELERQVVRARTGLPTAIRCSELFDLYEREWLPGLARGTREAYGDSLKPIRAFFLVQLQDLTVDRVQARHVAEFLAWRRAHRLRGAEIVSNRTLAKDRAVLSRIFSVAQELEYREGNPVSRVPAPKSDGRDPILLAADEYEALLEQCNDRELLRLYVLVLGEAGLRCESEALHLRWADVDLQQGFLWVASGREGHRTKSGKGRWVPMTPRLADAMRAHFARSRFAAFDGTRPEWIFHHAMTQRHHRAGDRIHSLRAAFTALVKRAKLPAGLRQHDLRHRRVTTWLAEGKPAALVQEAMGHSDIRVTMGYTHLAKEHLRALIDSPPAKAGDKTASA